MRAFLLKSGKFGAPALINIFSVTVSFSSRIWIAKLIGPHAFGIFSVWQNNVLLFGTTGTFGQQNLILKQLAPTKRADEVDATAACALKLTCGAALLSAAVGSAVFLGLQGGSTSEALWQTAAVVAFALMTTLAAIHRGLGSMIIGISFDRIVYQLVFIGLAIAGAIFLGGSWYATPAFAIALIVASLASLSYLRHSLGKLPLGGGRVTHHALKAIPYFLGSALLALNGRYLLAYSGIYSSGAVLGQVALVFTLANIIVIPTSTLNLVIGPSLARYMAVEHMRRQVAAFYLLTVFSFCLAGVGLVCMTYRSVFRFAEVPLTVDPLLIFLLTAGAAVAVFGNACLILEQFLGRAAKAARVFAIVMVSKLFMCYFVAFHFGLAGLALSDMLLGCVLAAILLGGLTAPLSTRAKQT